jgi:6-phosphogluconolactonase
MTTVGVEVFADPAALAVGAAARIAGALANAPGPRVSLGLAGGTSPAATYRNMRGIVPRWDRVDVWLPDERWVPHDHEDSNGRMAAEALFDHVNATFHRPRWAPWIEPDESAAHYEAVLRSIHPVDHPPDLVLLGLGDDGHTASLFSGTEALKAERRWYVSNFVASLDTWRLTATIPLLEKARQIYFMVEGEHKAEIVAQIIEGQIIEGQTIEGTAVGDTQFPAMSIAASTSEVTWLLDEAAARLLKR